MLQLFHVSKSYEGTDAIADITLEIGKGEFLFVTGQSGAGKSTLLKIMFGTDAPTKGSIIIEGRNYSRIPRGELLSLRRKTGFIFQDFKLLDRRTVFDNVAMSLKVIGLNTNEVKKRVLKALSYVKLQHRANFKAAGLSGGEQQRVAVARALVKEPQLLLADEPTGNLDPELSLEIMELFKEANNSGTTVVIATHDKALIERFNKKTITLEKGRLVD